MRLFISKNVGGIRAAVLIQGTTIISQIVVGVILARTLSVHDRGAVIATLLIAGLSVSIVAGGISSATATVSGEDSAVGVGAAVVVSIAACLSGGVIMIAGTLTPGVREVTDLWVLFTFGSLGVFGTCAAALASGSAKYSLSAAIQACPPLTALVYLGIALTAKTQPSAWSVVIAYLIGNALAAIVSISLQWIPMRRLLTRQPAGSGSLRTFVHNAIWMHPSSVSQLIGLRVDSVMLAVLGGPTAISHYTVASSYSSPMQLPNIILRGRLIALGRQTIRSPAPLLRRLGLWIVGCATALYIGLPVIPLVYGQPYRPSISLAAFLIFAGSLLFLRDTLANTLMGAGAAKSVAGVETILAVLSLPIYFFLISLTGARGAAMGSILVYGLGVGAFSILFRRARNTILEQKAEDNCDQ